jgi:hypothetical protein
MRSRFLVGPLLLVGVLAVGTLAASTVGATPSRQSIVVNFVRPTVVSGTIVQGQVVIVHDDELMAKGEPCTAVYRFDASRHMQEKIVSFMCKPTHRDMVQKFTVTCSRAPLTGPDVLVEYQFAGDKEAHGVPSYR